MSFAEPLARVRSRTCSCSTGSGAAATSTGARPIDRSAAAPRTPSSALARAAKFASVDVTVTSPTASLVRFTVAPARASVRLRSLVETPSSASTR